MNIITFLVSLLFLIEIIATIAIIGVGIVAVGVLMEEVKGNYDGFFHKIIDTLEDVLY